MTNISRCLHNRSDSSWNGQVFIKFLFHNNMVWLISLSCMHPKIPVSAGVGPTELWLFWLIKILNISLLRASKRSSRHCSRLSTSGALTYFQTRSTTSSPYLATCWCQSTLNCLNRVPLAQLEEDQVGLSLPIGIFNMNFTSLWKPESFVCRLLFSVTSFLERSAAPSPLAKSPMINAGSGQS